MFSRINSLGIYGMDAYPVKVEADITPGMYQFHIVGLPDAAVSEARDRVRSALRNSKKFFPSGHITVNLAPADIRKEGACYDLPILIALLVSSGQLDAGLEQSAFLGELSLSGEVRRINGVLPMLIKAREMGMKRIFIPAANRAEGAAIDGLEVYPVERVSDLLAHLTGEAPMKKVTSLPFCPELPVQQLDFSDVKGQETAKRAMEIAAAGGHNILMVGPPGSGKSMLAKRLPGILPDMTYEEAVETTMLHSIAGCLPAELSLVCSRPFRSPHHTTSPFSLSGGGSVPRPGEISLAHNGVLFLDEMPEFSRQVLEVLRQPLENGTITISRVSGTVTYPCSLMLVGAMNPCACGYFRHPTKQCSCSDKASARYLQRLSGPLLDRMDLQIEVPPVEYDTLSARSGGESSSEIRLRVNGARKRQGERLAGSGVNCNAHMTEGQLQQFCVLTEGGKALLRRVFEVLGLSARGHDKILKIARTIADLDCEEVIGEQHISEAVQYRTLDRKYFNRSGGV